MGGKLRLEGLTKEGINKRKKDELLLQPGGRVRLCSSSRYPGEKLLQVPHEDLSLLLDELLAAELQVAVHVLLRVDVVLLDLRRSLRCTETHPEMREGCLARPRASSLAAERRRGE